MPTLEPPPLPDALQPYAHEVEALMTLCLSLEPRPSARLLPPHASKFGGVPYLLDQRDWPEAEDGKPMTFVGQINFGELVSKLPQSTQLRLPEVEATSRALPPYCPTEGIFGFFYDLTKMVWGFDPGDARHWKTVWFPKVEDISPIEVPTDQPYAVPEFALVPRVNLSLASQYSIGTLSGDEERLYYCMNNHWPEEVRNAYDDFIASLSLSGHQVLGYPSPIQGDPRWDATLASNDVYCDDPKVMRSHPRFETLRAHYNDWQLLWQIDSDYDAGFEWGDLGRLYLMIRTEDLAEGDLGRPWLALQCF